MRQTPRGLDQGGSAPWPSPTLPASLRSARSKSFAKGRPFRPADIDDVLSGLEAGFSSDPAGPSVAVVLGHGARVDVFSGHLRARDGEGWYRRERSWNRATARLSRLIVGAESGAITLGAIRWCAEADVSVLVVDEDAKVLLAPTAGACDPRLLRLQAAPPDGLDVEAATILLGAKLRGQAAITKKHPRSTRPGRDDRRASPKLWTPRATSPRLVSSKPRRLRATSTPGANTQRRHCGSRLPMLAGCRPTGRSSTVGAAFSPRAPPTVRRNDRSMPCSTSCTRSLRSRLGLRVRRSAYIRRWASCMRTSQAGQPGPRPSRTGETRDRAVRARTRRRAYFLAP